MSSSSAQALTAKSRQRTAAKRATIEKLREKKPAEREFTTKVNGEEVSFLFRSIGNIAYDKLVNECPPTIEQQARGMQADQDKLAPKLLSRVCVDPELSEAEWAEIWKSPDWSRGEVMALYNEAGYLCLQGLELAPIAAG